VNLADVRSLFAYDEWANGRVLRCAAALTEEQYARPLAGSFPSIRETLGHIVVVEWVWLQRWRGVSPASVPEWAATAGAQRLSEELQRVEAERAAFLAALKDADLARLVSYVNVRGQPHAYLLGDLLVHLVNHSTYHRGQVTNMFRQVGATPPATDLLVFRDDVRTPRPA
jgi:uncharacterized damage-inducible protein DinB